MSSRQGISESKVRRKSLDSRFNSDSEISIWMMFKTRKLDDITWGMSVDTQEIQRPNYEVVGEKGDMKNSQWGFEERWQRNCSTVTAAAQSST